MRLFFYDMPLHFYNNISDLNVQICEDTNQIRRFDEKKYCQKGLINGGIYIINTLEPIFDRLSQRFSFETTPTSVNKNCGWDGLRSIFRRIFAMFTRRIRLLLSVNGPHTFSMAEA